MPPLRLLPELETAVLRLPGIRAVSVVTDADATPLEVHVVAVPGKPPKQVARDVQSLALAELGIALDHRKVSVVLFDDEIPPPAVWPPAGEACPRARVEHASVTTAGDQSVAVVVLAVARPGGGEHTTVGSALIRGDEPEAVARAVLDALDRRLDA